MKDGELLKLQPKAVEVLIALVARRGQLVSKESLLATVWPGAAIDDGAIAVHISALRKVLVLPDGTSPIETVPRLGYRFTAPATDLGHVAAAMDGPSPARAWTPLAAIAAAIAVTAAVATAVMLRDRSGSAAPSFPSSVALAVMPFQTLGLATGEDYVGIGVADALASQLALLPQFGVRPTSAVIERARTAADPIAAGRALEVQFVVSGMVQRIGDRLRVTVQLSDVATGTQRWSDRIDAPAADLLALQDTVAASVAGSLIDRFSDVDRTRLQAGQTKRPDAHTQFLRGRVFLNQAQAGALQQAVAAFERAVALDPQYSMAYASLSVAHRLLGIGAVGAETAAHAMPRARDAAERALALHKDVAEAHLTLGMVSFQYDWNWVEAEASLRRAVGLNPRSADARRSFGWFLAARGRFDEALDQLRQSTELDPVSILARENYGVALGLAGRYAEALAQLQAANGIDRGAPRPYLRQVPFYEALGQFDGAVKVWQDGLRAAGAAARAEAMGAAFARGGYAAVVRLEDPGSGGDPLNDAVFAAALNDGPRTIGALSRMVATRSTWVPFIKVDRRFDFVRGDPRFAEIFRAVGW